jgi:glycosyltransferase involved in cell wall biosynthesis
MDHRPLKILILTHNLRERGTWHRAWAIGRELALRGHRVILWTAAPHHYYRPVARRHGPADGKLIEVQTPSWAPLAGPDDGWGPLDVAWRSFRVLFESFDLCYAFAHPPNVCIPAWLASRLRRRPLLYDWCDWYAGGVFPKRDAARRSGPAAPREPVFQRRAERWEVSLERSMPRLARRVTVISDHLRRLTLEAGRREDEILLLPNGANLDGIVPADADEARRKLRLPATIGPILGYAANYHPDEALLLEAVAHARATVPQLRLLVAGAPLTDALVRRHGLEQTVIHLGRIPANAIGDVLAAADALALPLEDNPHNRARVPFKFTDYLASGRPVVTSPVGDLARWFAADASPIGAAAEPTPQAYGEAIARVLASPAADRAAMGRAARNLAETHFAWPGLVDQLEAFIEDWLGTKTKPA